VAKTADNRQDKSGKGKPGSGGKAVAKRADAKPGRRGQQQRSKAPVKSGRSGERRGLGKFLRDVRVELGKVTWPTRKDLVQSTLVVLVAVGIATVYTGVLDFVFAKAVDVILSVIK
jgi:preprotein translocase subunit SecE